MTYSTFLRMQVVELDGKFYALDRRTWNGELYKAYEVDEYGMPVEDAETVIIKEIVEEVEPDEWEVAGYEIR